MSPQQTPTRESIPVSEYVRGEFVPISHLAHGWELHSAVTLSPAEERTIVREPAQAVPACIAERIGKVRVLIVPYLGCSESGDVILFAKPKGETHSAVWMESGERVHLLIACRELDPHDTGFEFLAAVAELMQPKLSDPEAERYTRLLEEELRAGVRGEIDEDAGALKRSLVGSRGWHRNRAQFEQYRDVSFVSTLAEYMHGLWHDVQVRCGPEHLPVAELRRRMNLLAEMFPPNPGYRVFAEELEKTE